MSLATRFLGGATLLAMTAVAAHAADASAMPAMPAMPASASAPVHLPMPAGRTLLIVGQERGEIADYWKAVGPAGGYMLYTSLETLSNMDHASKGSGCGDSGWMSFPDWVEHYPGTAAQVGLYMVGMLPDIVSGDLDGQIDELGDDLRRTGRPVYLRIGYEFDGPWNRYDPELYRAAWRHVAQRLRGADGRGLPNVAFVWHSAAFRRFRGEPLAAWYPGDDVVDWVALSWFGWGSEGETADAAQAREDVAAFARAHARPLMIAESAPKQYAQADRADAWERWYAPLFAWIERNDVRAYSAINQDWRRLPQWSDAACGNGTDWGDTRVHKPGSTILERWRATVAAPRFVRQGDPLLAPK